jgi:hypothetical protein
LSFGSSAAPETKAEMESKGVLSRPSPPAAAESSMNQIISETLRVTVAVSVLMPSLIV